MGYRSDVVAIFYPNTSLSDDLRVETYSMFKTLMHTTYKDVLDEWKEDFEWFDSRRVLQFKCDSVKWYPSYPAVSRFEEFFNEIRNNDVDGMECEFMRLGEEDDDVERTSSHHSDYRLSISRSIEVDI